MKSFDGEGLMCFEHLVRMSAMAVGYVLINVAPGKEHEVYLAVKDMPFVDDATLLFGDHDLIVKLVADSLTIIAQSVVESIRQIPGIVDTKTLAGAEL
jgi:DNA-binding Lrp family transcriptional regulator